MKLSDVIIYSDFDGTISQGLNGKTFLSDEVVMSIKKFINAGGRFGISSGRSHQSVISYFDGYELNLPYIEANGAFIFDADRKEYVYQKYITNEVKERVYKYVLNDNRLMMTVMNSNGTHKVRLNDERDERIIDFERPFLTYDEMLQEDLAKCAILGDENAIKEINSNISSLGLDGLINASSSAPFYLEIFDLEVSKGNAVKRVIKEYGLENKVLVCIGDYMNDMSMMKVADIAICPDNAIKEIKEVSDYVTKANNKQDIIKEVIEYLGGLNYVKNED